MSDEGVAAEVAISWRTSDVELPDGRIMGWPRSARRTASRFCGSTAPRCPSPGSPAAVEFAETEGVRLIGVERPGVGRSTPHRYARVIDFATDAVAVMDALGLDRVGLIGLSGGGPYVLAVCAATPDRVVAAAVLGGVGPSAGPERVGPGGIIPVLRRFSPVVNRLAEPAGWVMSCGLRLVAPVADRVFDVYMVIGPKSDRAFLARPEMRAMFLDDLVTSGRESFRAVAYDAVLFSRWWGFDISSISTPVFLWHGDADLVIPLVHGERMAALIPIRHSVVPGEGHLAMLDAAEEAIELILAQR